MSSAQPQVRRLGPSLREDFFRLHSEANGCGLCQCVAWWVPTWEGWGDRTAEDNRRLRLALFERGEDDGYLLYVAGTPVGWCQAGVRDRLDKLVRQYAMTSDPSMWAITCFLLATSHRKQGLARHLLDATLADLRARGARRVQVFPKRGAGLEADDLWTGPEALYRDAGFTVVRDDASRPVLQLEL